MGMIYARWKKLCLLYRICVACNIVCNSMYSLTVLNCCVYGGHMIDKCFVETVLMQDFACLLLYNLS